VDKKSIAATFSGQQGLIRSLHMPYSVDDLLNHVRKHFGDQKVAFVYEAGPTGYGLYDGLVAQGYRCLIAAPSMIPRATAGRQWTLRVKAQLRKLRCSRTVRFKLDQLLDRLEFCEKQVVSSTKEIRRFCKEDAELFQSIEYLMSIPGIGWIVASQLLARIGDWREIDNVRQLGSFLGLVPTENSTGDSVDRGSITRAGDGRLRSKMIQAAWSAIRQDAELREFYRSVCQRNPRGKGSRIAIVAVARKLSTRICAVLKNQRPYIVREQVHSAPLTQEETSPQGNDSTLRRTGRD
jgi:transposase